MRAPTGSPRVLSHLSMEELMRASRIVLLAGMICLSVPVAQAADQTGFVLRYGVGYVDPTGDLDVSFLGDPATIEYESQIGYFLSGEYKFSSVFGLESTVLFSNPNVRIEGDDVRERGDGIILPILLGPSFHVTANKPVDFYFSVFGAYVIYDNIDFDSFTEDINSDFGYGGGIAITVPFEEAWCFDVG